MKKTLRTATYFTVIMIIVFYAFSTIYAAAADDYTLLVPLPGLPGSGVTALGTYLPAVFNLAIGIAAVMAFVAITWGGITYATSDAITGKAQGREWITNAIWGLLLVIGAWVILYTINPQILKFDLKLETPNVQAGEPTVTAGGACTNCTSLSAAGLPVKESISGASISQTIIGRLTLLNQSLKSNGVSWRITEGYPPSYVHKDSCHANGTCIDASLSNPTLSNIQTFFSSTRSSGMSGQYEVTSVDQLKQLLGDNVRIINNYANDSKGNMYMVNTAANGAHFHIR